MNYQRYYIIIEVLCVLVQVSIAGNQPSLAFLTLGIREPCWLKTLNRFAENAAALIVMVRFLRVWVKLTVARVHLKHHRTRASRQISDIKESDPAQWAWLTRTSSLWKIQASVMLLCAGALVILSFVEDTCGELQYYVSLSTAGNLGIALVHRLFLGSPLLWVLA